MRRRRCALSLAVASLALLALALAPWRAARDVDGAPALLLAAPLPPLMVISKRVGRRGEERRKEKGEPCLFLASLLPLPLAAPPLH